MYTPSLSRRVRKQMDRLQGTLDTLIRKAVSLGPLHGYGILLRIQQISKDRLQYRVLYRRDHQGWITSECGESENKRKLQTDAEKWNRIADVIAGILQITSEEV